MRKDDDNNGTGKDDNYYLIGSFNGKRSWAIFGIGRSEEECIRNSVDNESVDILDETGKLSDAVKLLRCTKHAYYALKNEEWFVAGYIVINSKGVATISEEYV